MTVFQKQIGSGRFVAKQVGAGLGIVQRKQLSNVIAAGVVLLDPTLAEFKRLSTASYLTSASTLAYVTNDVLRLEDRGDGLGALPLFEGRRTQWVGQTQALGGAPWSVLASATVTSNTNVAPDGTTTGCQINYAASTSSAVRCALSDPSPPQNTVVAMSWWYHAGTGTNASPVYFIDKNAAFKGGVVSVGTTTWQRGDFTANTGTTAAVLTLNFQNNPGGTAHQFVAWGVQLETGNFPSSYIANAAGGHVDRAEDVCQFLSSQVPVQVRQGRWSQPLYPIWANTDALDGEEYWSHSFTTQDGLRLRRTAGVTKLEAVVGGVVVASSNALTFARQATLACTVDPVAGVLTVNASAGPTGTPWAWPPNTPMRQGGIIAGGNELFGRMGPMVSA